MGSKGNQWDPRGINGIQGESMGIQGESMGIQGESMGIQGKSMGIQGESMGIQGESMGIQGNLGILVIFGNPEKFGNFFQKFP